MSQWTQAEDDILKKGVQKYGTGKWAAVSALIPTRKAKEVKRRYESMVRQDSEWTEEKDQNLLKLVKALGNSWSTIAQMVEMPAQQCMERAELLENRSAGLDDNTTLISATSAAFEHHKAKPNPQDLDDETREAIATAEARMSQDNGRKAQRKLRERTEAAKKEIAAVQAASARGDDLPGHKASNATDIFSAQNHSTPSANLNKRPKITNKQAKSPARNRVTESFVVDLTDDVSDDEQVAKGHLMIPKSVKDVRSETGASQTEIQPKELGQNSGGLEDSEEVEQLMKVIPKAVPQKELNLATMQEKLEEQTGSVQVEQEEPDQVSDQAVLPVMEHEPLPSNNSNAQQEGLFALEDSSTSRSVDSAEQALAAEASYSATNLPQNTSTAVSVIPANQSSSEFDISDSDDQEQEVLQMDELNGFEQNESMQVEEGHEGFQDDPGQVEAGTAETVQIEHQKVVEAQDRVEDLEENDVKHAKALEPLVNNLSPGDSHSQVQKHQDKIETEQLPQRSSVAERKPASRDASVVYEALPDNTHTVQYAQKQEAESEQHKQNQASVVDHGGSRASSPGLQATRQPARAPRSHSPQQDHARPARRPTLDFKLEVPENPHLRDAKELERKLKAIAAGEVLPVPQCSETLHEQVKRWIPRINLDFKCTEPRFASRPDDESDISEVRETFESTTKRNSYQDAGGSGERNGDDRKEDSLPQLGLSPGGAGIEKASNCTPLAKPRDLRQEGLSVHEKTETSPPEDLLDGRAQLASPEPKTNRLETELFSPKKPETQKPSTTTATSVGSQQPTPDSHTRNISKSPSNSTATPQTFYAVPTKVDLTMDESVYMSADDTFTRPVSTPKRALPETIHEDTEEETPVTKKQNLDPTSNEWLDQFGGLFDA